MNRSAFIVSIVVITTKCTVRITVFCFKTSCQNSRNELLPSNMSVEHKKSWGSVALPKIYIRISCTKFTPV